ncbi:Uncharacterised protein [Salmonella enterica]|nr:Uncharacterised protein [Salmonella enterica]SUF49776.1 Uncharacterised protein [Salmonella enterica]
MGLSFSQISEQEENMRFMKAAMGWLLLLLLFAIVVHYGLHLHLFTS